MKLHSEEVAFKCQVCGKEFATLSLLTAHESDHAVVDDDWIHSVDASNDQDQDPDQEQEQDDNNVDHEIEPETEDIESEEDVEQEEDESLIYS